MTSPQVGEQLSAPFQLAQIFATSAAMSHRGNPLTRAANTPHSPQQINIALGMQHLNDGEATQVFVRVQTNPDDGDEKALYDFTVEMTAVVERIDRAAFPDKDLIEVVATMIFPFIRETVANLTTRGRFGPVWINPFNIRNAVHQALAKADESTE